MHAGEEYAHRVGPTPPSSCPSSRRSLNGSRPGRNIFDKLKNLVSPRNAKSREAARLYIEEAGNLASNNATREHMVLVADPGPDPDDVKVILMSAIMHKEGTVVIEGIINNGGHQAQQRTALAYATLKHLGMANQIPVAVGSAGVPYSPKDHEYRLEGYADALHMTYPTGAALLTKVLKHAEPNSIIIQIQSGFTDIATAIKSNPKLFSSKVKKCSIMGGLEKDSGTLSICVPVDVGRKGTRPGQTSVSWGIVCTYSSNASDLESSHNLRHRLVEVA
jgi:hypothetical protein